MTGRLLPIIGILIAIGLFFGYINPTYTGPVAEARAQVREYDRALRAAAEFERKENELLAERSSIPEDDLERIEAFLPAGVDNVQLILDLDALASRSGVTLSGFDVAPPPTEEEQAADLTTFDQTDSPIRSLTLSVSASGTYAAFRTFLDGIEHSLRLLDVVSLSITDSATGVYTYEMTFRIYWLP